MNFIALTAVSIEQCDDGNTATRAPGSSSSELDIARRHFAWDNGMDILVEILPFDRVHSCLHQHLARNGTFSVSYI